MPLSNEYKRRVPFDRAMKLTMGRCHRCPKPIWKGKSIIHCRKHVLEIRESEQKRRIKRQEMGLCRDCLKPIWKGKSIFHCKKHVLENRERQRKNQEMGLCHRCPKPIWKGKSTYLCRKHVLYSREYQRKHRTENRIFALRQLIIDTQLQAFRTWAPENPLSLKKN